MQILYILASVILIPVGFVCLRLFSFFIKYQLGSRKIKGIPRQASTFSILNMIGEAYEQFWKESLVCLDPKNPSSFIQAGPHLDGGLTIGVSNPDVFRDVLGNMEQFPKYPVSYEAIEVLIGRGLVNLEGEEWKKERRVITPLFHHGSLKLQVPITSDVAELLVKDLRAHNAQPVSPSYREYTMRVIIATAFGNAFDVKWMADKYTVLSHQLNDWFLLVSLFGNTLVHYIPLPSVINFKSGIKEVYTKLQEIIAIKRKQIAKEAAISGSSTNYDPDAIEDLMTLMLQSDPSISDTQVMYEGLTFLFAGSDTSNCLLLWATYFLAMYPDIQHRIFEETSSVLQSDLVPGADHLPKLRYTRAFLMECLRMRPPVVGIERLVPEDRIIDGVMIPAGSCLYLNFQLAHMNPNFWENPTEFRPERFLSEGQAKSHPFAFVPFSAGGRNCIGQKLALQESLILLGAIVKNFQIRDGDSLEKVKMSNDPLLMPAHLKVKYIPR